MAKTSAKQISILGGSYLQPIADLVSKLAAEQPKARNRGPISSFENGYSASIVLLTVAMFESYTVRLAHLRGLSNPAERLVALKVIGSCIPNLRNRKALEDVFVLRDLIFHNHLWELEYSWGSGSPPKLSSANKPASKLDSKYQNRVNEVTRRTRALGLNVLPTQVNRGDAKKVLHTIWSVLQQIESKRLDQLSLASLRVKVGKSHPLFTEVFDQL